MQVAWHKMESLPPIDDCGRTSAAMSIMPDVGVGGGACCRGLDRVGAGYS